MPARIPYEQATRIKDIPDDVLAEAYGEGTDAENVRIWATTETLEGLRAIGIEPEILEERPVLPVFHGFSRFLETVGYEEMLSCIAYAKFNAAPMGVAYVGTNCENELWQMHYSDLKGYFFYYSRNEMRPYIWIAVCNQDAADFLCSIYHQDSNMVAWLTALGFAPLLEEVV